MHKIWNKILTYLVSIPTFPNLPDLWVYAIEDMLYQACMTFSNYDGSAMDSLHASSSSTFFIRLFHTFLSTSTSLLPFHWFLGSLFYFIPYFISPPIQILTHILQCPFWAPCIVKFSFQDIYDPLFCCKIYNFLENELKNYVKCTININPLKN